MINNDYPLGLRSTSCVPLLIGFRGRVTRRRKKRPVRELRSLNRHTRSGGPPCRILSIEAIFKVFSIYRRKNRFSSTTTSSKEADGK
jgi:hypothetical protein